MTGPGAPLSVSSCSVLPAPNTVRLNGLPNVFVVAPMVIEKRPAKFTPVTPPPRSAQFAEKVWPSLKLPVTSIPKRLFPSVAKLPIDGA